MDHRSASPQPDTPAGPDVPAPADTATPDGPGSWPWEPGAATGVGSLPGTRVREAVRMVLGELPGLPHLPELPARGAGADMIGRTVGLLAQLYGEVRPSGWRIADRPGRDHRRAAAWLGEDLDALEEYAQGYAGALKVQAAGPWTLAATVELAHGDKALSDPGACRDLAASLAEGLTTHLADVTRRVPGARLLVQLDEPALPGVLAGTVPTASGFGMLRRVERPDATEALREVIGALRRAGALVAVHCCAAGAPLDVIRGAGAHAAGLDAALLSARQDDELGACVDSGMALLLGVVPALDARLSDPEAMIDPARRLWRRLGFEASTLARAVIPTPACGLAGASPGYARAAMTAAREAGRSLVDDPEG